MMSEKTRKSRTKRIWLALLVLVLGIVVSVGIQFAVNMGIQSLPQRPLESINAGGSDRLIYYFDQWLHQDGLPDGIELTETFINEELTGTYAYIDGRYDCADFRMNSLVRLYLSYYDYLPVSTRNDIRRVMLDFKYWMDQGGEDSMCYWSENHQILFATQEYLIGQTFPDAIFSVDQKTGAEHMQMAEERINAWMEQRFLYGFTEWYSNNYYPEDIAPMANFIQFANDPEMVNRMKMIMDLLWMDMATQSYRHLGQDSSGAPRTYYIFVSSSGRMYSDNRVSDETGNRMRPYLDYILQKEATRDFAGSWSTSTNGFFNCFKQMMEAQDDNLQPYYEVPEVISQIFNDPATEQIIRSSQSLDVSELLLEGLLGQGVAQMMMQWNMEAFTNPEVIDNTMRYIATHKMFSNDFLNDFKLINLWPLRAFNLLKFVSKTLQPSTNGVAIERANVYTYRTPHFSMHNAQAYHVGAYADQHAIQSLNLNPKLSIFTSQPAKIPRRSGTPTYWVGNGRQPMSVQEKNVTFQLYLPPEKEGFMEPMVVKNTTHAYFPLEWFDEVVLTHLADGYIFGRSGEAYVMIKARHALRFVAFATSHQSDDRDNLLDRGSVSQLLSDDYDLIQEGEGFHYFVIEASSSDQETFNAFVQRTLANNLTFSLESQSLQYETRLYQQAGTTVLEAYYDGRFLIDHVVEDLNYPRYRNPYVEDGVIPRKSDVLTFDFGGHRLVLDYANNIRDLAP